MSEFTELLKDWKKTPNETLRALILAHDDREPLEALHGFEKLKTAQIIERLTSFKTKAKDPRVTRALETLVVEARWSSDGAKPMWRAVFELVSRTADPRLKHLKPAFAVRASMHDWLESQYTKAIAELPDAFAPVDESKWSKALASQPKPKAKPDARDEAGLFEAVYAAPTDDAPRLVLADFLTEKGDPRGEFISLQCGPRDEKRERALVKQHSKAWLAHFGPSLGADVEWRRGFPTKGLAKFKAKGDAEKYGTLSAWATFEELRWHDGGSSEDPKYTRFIGANFRALTHASGPNLRSLIDAAPFPHLEELATWLREAADFAALTDVKRFPKLRTLYAGGSVMMPWLKPLASLGAIKVLELGQRDKLEEMLPALARFSGLEEVRLPPNFMARRGPSGAFDQLHLIAPGAHLSGRYWQLAAPIPDGLFATLEVAPEATAPEDELAKLRAKIGTARKPAPPPSNDTTLPPLNRYAPIAWLDAKHVVVGLPGHIALVDVSGAKPTVVRSLPAQRMVTAVRVIEHGATVLSATHTELRGLDPQTGETKWSIEHAYDSSAVLNVSADGRRIARMVGVLDVPTCTEVPPPKGAKGDRRAPDDSCWLRREDVGTWQVRRPGVRLGAPLEDCTRVASYSFTPHGVVGRTDLGLRLWNIETGKVAAKLDCELNVGFTAALSNDGRFIVTGAGESAIVARMPDLQKVGEAKAPGQATQCAVRDDGQRVAVVCGDALLAFDV